MISARILAMSIAWVVMSSSVLSAQDLSRYREFQLGMSLVAVAQQAGITSEARVLHQRPGLIQELMWLPPLGSSRQGDSARKVLFNGYNGQLFRIVVNYDRDRTEGLTAEDMVEALSAKYGLATLPTSEISPSLSWGASNDSDKILAAWEDSQYSVKLFRSSHSPTFGLVVFSKQLDALARAATVKAIRLDAEQAPQREIERQPKQTEESRVRQEKARGVNKATFRP
ncbi:MAG: hypothetical protein ACRD3C_25150 [Vicinamibacterales bacterium]